MPPKKEEPSDAEQQNDLLVTPSGEVMQDLLEEKGPLWVYCNDQRFVKGYSKEKGNLVLKTDMTLTEAQSTPGEGKTKWLVTGLTTIRIVENGNLRAPKPDTQTTKEKPKKKSKALVHGKYGDVKSPNLGSEFHPDPITWQELNGQLLFVLVPAVAENKTMYYTMVNADETGLCAVVMIPGLQFWRAHLRKGPETRKRQREYLWKAEVARITKYQNPNPVIPPTVFDIVEPKTNEALMSKLFQLMSTARVKLAASEEVAIDDEIEEISKLLSDLSMKSGSEPQVRELTSLFLHNGGNDGEENGWNDQKSNELWSVLSQSFSKLMQTITPQHLSEIQVALWSNAETVQLASLNLFLQQIQVCLESSDNVVEPHDVVRAIKVCERYSQHKHPHVPSEVMQRKEETCLLLLKNLLQNVQVWISSHAPSKNLMISPHEAILAEVHAKYPLDYETLEQTVTSSISTWNAQIRNTVEPMIVEPLQELIKFYEVLVGNPDVEM